ncbi:MAG: hypothetical protein H7287_05315 [Thermoleophilia bacterium]|nr:hypothetical protein [Thermoleophilia bacterium]
MTYEDDINEFDLLLEDDEEVAPRGNRTAVSVGTAAPRRAMRPAADREAAPRANGSRVRVTPDWNRIAAVLFVAVIALLIVWFAVSTIRSHSRSSAYKAYFGQVRDIASKSTDQGAELNTILTDANAGDRTQRVQRIQQLSTRAAKLAKDAAALKAPDQLTESQQWFVTSLDYRARGLSSLQRSITDTTKTTNRAKSADNVAAAMSRFVASDVVWSDSFATGSRDVLKRDEVADVIVPESAFVTNLDDVSPASVGKMLDRISAATVATRGGTAAVPKDGKIRGGQLEGGQITVAPTGTTLSLTSTNMLTLPEGFAFEVPFTNQGEVQLTNVPVRITIRGDNSDPIVLTGTIDSVDPGQTESAKITFDGVPTFGEVLTLDFMVGPIAGEKKTDNNTTTAKAQFSLS